MLLIFTVCAPEALTASYVVRISWTVDLEKLWSNVSYVSCGLMKNAPRWGAYSISVITASDARSINPNLVYKDYCIQIQSLLYSNLVQTRVSFNSLKTHHWIMISSISCEDIFAPLYTCIIGVTVPIRYYDMDYMGFKVEQYWYIW